MGLTRKTTSLLTFGLVDFLSDQERTARSARLTKRYNRRQWQLAKQEREERAAERREQAQAEARHAAELEYELSKYRS